MSAAEADKAVAEVRSAIELTDDQRARLAEALEQATGKQVEVKVVVDPTVLGGLVTTSATPSSTARSGPGSSSSSTPSEAEDDM